jgi:glycosyltransferase involved in cell wall biosynthesis
LPAADVTICNTVFLPVWLRRRYPQAGRVVAVVARMPKGQTRFYRRVDLVLALSAAVAEAIARENPALVDRTAPFPFPIDWERHAVAARRAPKADAARPVTVGYIGRIHPEKGISLLLEAAIRLKGRSDLPPWKLMLAGPTDVEAGGGGHDFVAGLKTQYALRLGDALSLLGPEFDAARLASRYATIDIFCYPSLAERGETFGVAVAEAMACAAAPVVSQLECFQDLVQPGRTGLTFDHRADNAAEQLAGALAQLIQDAPRRAQMGSNAQEHARQFDFAAVANTVDGYLRHLIALPATERFSARNFTVESKGVSPRV